MHYYQKNIGDYARDTGHLTALEHGVYALLLDWYYLNERPITMKEAIRVSRGNPDETQVVLSEFFKETAEGWIHSYADRVIGEYHAKAERNRVNGAKGGRPAKEVQPVDSIESKTQVVSSGMPEITLTHKPLTINQEPKEKALASPKGSRLPDDWTPPEDWLAWARSEKPGINALQEADKFRDYWHGVAGAKARKANWLSTWRNWVRNANVQPANRNSNGYSHAQPKLTPSELTAVGIALNNGGEIPDGYENNGGVVAEVERNLRSQVDLGLRDGRNRIGGADLGQGIKWLNGGASG